MNDHDLLNLLADHADALNESGDVAGLDTAVWLNHHASTQAQALWPLFHLAKSVKLALHPVQPPAFFKAELRQQLEQSSVTGIDHWAIGRFVWLTAALLGSVVSIIVILRRWKMLPNGSDVIGTAV